MALSKKTSSELLAPAGDFQAALTALSARADAIYLGLKNFSARKSAANFSFQELQRLKTKTSASGQKIYVTLNTIIKEDEFEELFQTLSTLSAIKVDAVIIQDIGLLYFIKKYFPQMAVHASTQMAIHNSAGLAMAYELGINRVVLSRELSFNDIGQLRKEHPKMELEVFIHGALCYSFSGMCLASGLLLNRSGNRGRCAQLCRNYFEHDNNYKFFFSCNDLHFGKAILKLQDIGINSFKIEGRMKPKEYIQTTLELYRAILDNPSLTPAEYEQLLQKQSLTFSRKKTLAYFHNNQGNELINNTNSGHQGIVLGSVSKVEGKNISIKLINDLHKNDLMLFLKNGINKVRFVAFSLRNVSGRPVDFVPAGATAITSTQNYDTPTIGTEILLIDHPANAIPDIDHKKILPTPIDINCEIIASDSDLSFEINSTPKLRYKFDLPMEPARGESDFCQILQGHFDEHGDSLYKIVIKKFLNRSNLVALFARPSAIKKIKNELYHQIASDIADYQIKRLSPIDIKLSPLTENLTTFLQTRKNLNPPAKNLPFASLDDLQTNNLTNYEHTTFIPLLPILLDEVIYFEELERLIKKNSTQHFCLGINNLSHLHLVKKLNNTSFFIDFYFYVANTYTIAQLINFIPTPIFVYAWAEEKSWSKQLIEIKDKQSLPLFISQGCYHKHNMENGHCPHQCPKNFNYSLTNGKKKYQVIISDCLTYLFAN
ncbi:MAG: hypothetical protein A2504_09185 [Bdellovibrionales bacterium RIFOXYD12_FULL_39_22]|nr:MAG: hypothetical protein A2385_17365 [Bdellovibrionales bacterium RIFOXYB1_FULL_39_21]OFZ41085.1 MAG: hypothetical protein A2485_00290 [Bdellovibrionales bacterium RIFOXYC12_FULL_39_17]OFZ50298.1 MAG: hypothetical protein A2404_07605 [Bdellovibrionales bacterium RIFOXYC1_FULL_39_130]OFZ75099.1 MAG: hypothetical protein A2560_16300 [Bdellovibrionales bacterium RIFOXYD1_FULL_39_84]OFZ92259.1 MAG: hypothetical protein A2504_09185 [Bdellovibrionales bacterium RIFOXYD12_FULL_39_22]HLE10938.1 pe